MKYIYLLMISSIGFSQEKPYVIEVAANKNTFLYFPSPIEKGLTGNTNYHFGYNTKKAEKFGVLKASSQGEESTLHVITKDQNVYSFILRYNSKATQFDHFFKKSQSLGSMNKEREQIASRDNNISIEKAATRADKITESNYHIEKIKTSETDINFSKELIERGQYYKKFSRKNSDVVLRLSNIAYKGDKSFIFLTIQNKSTVDYDVDFIQFNKTARKKNKKSTNQSIEIQQLSNHNGFKRINSGETQSAVYIFEKLSIDKSTIVNIELIEAKGDRNIKLPVSHQYINNPNN